MPHYKNGTPAAIGDTVRGHGYNVKHEIVGRVVGITPGSSSCNIQVAHIVTEELARVPFFRSFVQKGAIGCGPDGGKDGTPRIGAVAELEYGQCDAFEKIG